MPSPSSHNARLGGWAEGLDEDLDVELGAIRVMARLALAEAIEAEALDRARSRVDADPWGVRAVRGENLVSVAAVIGRPSVVRFESDDVVTVLIASPTPQPADTRVRDRCARL